MAQGAYGFTFTGIPASPELLDDPSASWPEIDVRIHERPVAGEEMIGPDVAVFRLGRGSARLDRRRMTVDCAPPRRIPYGALVHPLLTTWSSIFSLWHGREVLHAGAALLGDGAWALAGTPGAGKSTTLAALALAGVPILADDAVILEDGDVLAGPRCIDLRPSAGRFYRGAGPLPKVRGTQRRRLGTPPGPARAPLRGLISLAWGPTVQVRPLAADERLRLLLAQRNMGRLPPRSSALLDLATLPAIELTRPATMHSLPAIVDALREVAAEASQNVMIAEPPAVRSSSLPRSMIAGGS